MSARKLRCLSYFAVFMLVVFIPQTACGSAEELQDAFIAVSQRVGPAVVSISTEHIEHIETLPFPGYNQDEFFREFFKEFFGGIPEKEVRRLGLGSGVIIDADGYILTNEHVIQGADRITVTLSDGREFSGVVKGADYRSDLAIIKIESKDLPVAILGNSEDVKTGQWVVAIGNPFGYALLNSEPTVTVGVVSALGRSLRRTSYRERNYTDLVQTDAAINPGNSGGPLVNIKGEVIGINVAIISQPDGPPSYQGMGFAIPINAAKFILTDLVAGKEIEYGYIGVNIQDLDEALAQYFHLTDTKGVLVASVYKNSPAAEAGLMEGDIVKAYNSQPVSSVKDLIKMVGKTKVGDSAALRVLRSGKLVDRKIKIGRRPKDVNQLMPATPEARPWRGMVVKEMSPELAERLQLDKGTGVLVIQVESGSPADEAGLRPGHLIREINKNKVTNISVFNKLVSPLHGDILIRTNRGYVVIGEK